MNLLQITDKTNVKPLVSIMGINHSLHSWSFYRLAQFIEYKAKLASITVESVRNELVSRYIWQITGIP